MRSRDDFQQHFQDSFGLTILDIPDIFDISIKPYLEIRVLDRLLARGGVIMHLK
jgi:hypothetical protein